MKAAAVGVSLLSLAGTIVPPILFLRDALSAEGMHVAMLAATAFWFASAPIWMGSGDGHS